MRNKLIALMAIIPLIVLFTLMTFTRTASVAVDIPVAGVELKTDAEDGVINIDISDYEYDKYIGVEVLPLNAKNRGYDLEYSSVDGGTQGRIELDKEGRIIPRETGMVKVTAVTRDGGYRASVIVNVTASKAVGARFFATDEEGERVFAASSSRADLEIELGGGEYVFTADALPASVHTDVRYTLSDSETGLQVHPVTGRARAVFSGEYLLTVSMTPADREWEEFTVLVKVSQSSPSVQGMGERAETVFPTGARECELYVESPSFPQILSLPDGVTAEVLALSEREGRYVVEVAFGDGFSGREAEIKLLAGGKTLSAEICFEDPKPTLYGRYIDASTSCFVQKKGTTLTYAVSDEPPLPEGAVYRLEIESEGVRMVASDEERGEFTLTASAEGECVLTLYAVCGDTVYEAERRTLRVAESYNSFVFAENAEEWGIGGVLAIGGLEVKEGGFVAAENTLSLKAMRGLEVVPITEGAALEVSDPSLARVSEREGKVVVEPLGTGRVTVYAAWKYAEAFREEVRASVILDVVADGVNVGDYESLRLATDEGYAVVLTEDIMLGENMFREDGYLKDGADLSPYVRTLETTADWTYYKNRGSAHPTVKYLIEFRNDVYGNGKALDADYITQVTPLVSSSVAVFKGPLDLAAFPGLASVKAQDNISFLVRTDGVTIDNVVLRGCSDESLYDEGKLELGYLDTVGTVLELMADCRVINSRVMNGRTCVRAFGRYGVENIVSESSPVDAEKEKIEVSLESSVLSNAREFILKMGTNRKVRGEYIKQGTAYDLEAMEPSLSLGGVTYAPRDDGNLADEAFMSELVLTEVTLKDCALTHSGLFSVGLECSFAGPMLDGEMLAPYTWRGLAGTSYPALLRLEGDVRLYDWKELSDVDSSTLIEVSGGITESNAFLQLDLGEMLKRAGEDYADIICPADGGEYVHGGIAFYGGGKNYSVVDLSAFEGELPTEYSVNLSVLMSDDDDADSILNMQGEMLPLAAGTQDFRFFMYDAKSESSYAAQREALASGKAYSFISPADRWA